MKILNFGSLNIDKVYSVKNIVKEGETIDSINYKENAGGKGLNQSIAISRAKGIVYHAGLIGRDGEFLKRILDDNSVDVSLIEYTNTVSGQAIIQVDEKGKNCIILYHGANYEIEENFVDRVLQNFQENDILLLQNEISNLNYIIQQAKIKKMKIYLNPSPINKNLMKCNFLLLNGIFINEHEASYLSGKPITNIKGILDSLSNTYPKLEIILTLGDKGAFYRCGNEQIFQSAYKVKAIDTTAAGDTFTGYYITLKQQGKSIKKCMEIASKAASIAVTRKGASISIPMIDEVLKA